MCSSENVKINNVFWREIAKLWLIFSLDGYVSNKNKCTSYIVIWKDAYKKEYTILYVICDCKFIKYKLKSSKGEEENLIYNSALEQWSYRSSFLSFGLSEIVLY